MNLSPLRWKTKNVGYGLLISILLYILLLHKWSFKFVHEDSIPNSNPKHVWEHVADFSNMLKLNTIIENFRVVNESGNYDDWKYSVEYTEHLRNLPSLKNTALGHYSVRQIEGGFLISSEHRTCFLFNKFGCLDTTSEFIFTLSGKDTACTEIIQYQCPLLFSILCEKEVLEQRQDIMSNLKEEFSRTKIR